MHDIKAIRDDASAFVRGLTRRQAWTEGEAMLGVQVLVIHAQASWTFGDLNEMIVDPATTSIHRFHR